MPKSVRKAIKNFKLNKEEDKEVVNGTEPIKKETIKLDLMSTTNTQEEVYNTINNPVENCEIAIEDNFIEATKVDEVIEIRNISGRTLKPKNNSNVQEIQLDLIDVEPIVIDEIHDTQGIISNNIIQIEDMFGVHVVPFIAGGILPQVKSLKSHKIINVGGLKCASGTNRIINRDKLNAYASKITNTISTGQVFEESLLEKINIKGTVYEVLKFNHYELSVLNSMCINLPFIVYTNNSGDYRINVGGYAV